MAKRIIAEIKELETLAGQELGVSDWMPIEQDRIDLFAEATGDWQWIHVDPERARRESPFGTTIAHGHLILSLTPKFLSEIIEVEGARLLVNPGFERMRIRSPVRSSDRIRMRASLKKLRPLPGGAMHGTIHFTFEIEGQRKPAAFGDAMIVYYP
jgi:acyl dehydratase